MEAVAVTTTSKLKKIVLLHTALFCYGHLPNTKVNKMLIVVLRFFRLFTEIRFFIINLEIFKTNVIKNIKLWNNIITYVKMM